jgi:hypothetical protein
VGWWALMEMMSFSSIPCGQELNLKWQGKKPFTFSKKLQHLTKPKHYI